MKARICEGLSKHRLKQITGYVGTYNSSERILGRFGIFIVFDNKLGIQVKAPRH